MGYRIIWDKKVYQTLHKLEPIVARRIVKLVKEFSIDPNSKDIKVMAGDSVFRLRAGDYRVIISIDKDSEVINVLKVGHRKNIYKNSKYKS
jgi:mRNA interferase RelE/StbE